MGDDLVQVQKLGMRIPLNSYPCKIGIKHYFHFNTSSAGWKKNRVDSVFESQIFIQAYLYEQCKLLFSLMVYSPSVEQHFSMQTSSEKHLLHKQPLFHIIYIWETHPIRSGQKNPKLQRTSLKCSTSAEIYAVVLPNYSSTCKHR